MIKTILEQEQARWGPEIERRLAAFVEERRGRTPARLLDAMAHCLLAGGKRVRPLLVLEAAAALGGQAAIERTWPGALAVECVHTYSLVHDDLPAMDDDDLRRGKPTAHKVYGEAIAILAGDALLTDAFALVAASEIRAGPMALALALAAGSAGMVAGQHRDMEAEGEERSVREMEAIHRGKTGELFGAACVLGGHAAEADHDALARLREYGLLLGLAFQIADDVLDVEGDPAARGKRQGGDEERAKSTYVKLLGLEGAKARAREVAEEAAALVEGLRPAGDEVAERGAASLVELARFAALRKT